MLNRITESLPLEEPSQLELFHSAARLHGLNEIATVETLVKLWDPTAAGFKKQDHTSEMSLQSCTLPPACVQCRETWIQRKGVVYWK